MAIAHIYDGKDESGDNSEGNEAETSQEAQGQEIAGKHSSESSSGATESSNTDPYLEKAIAQGYDPDYQGDNKKTPEQFVRDGEWMKTVHSLKQEITKDRTELERMKESMKHMDDLYKKSLEQAEKEAMAKLKAQKLEAMENGEHSKVVEIEDQMEDLKSTSKPVEGGTTEKKDNSPQGVTEPTAAFVEWRNNNSWYDEMPELQVEADMIGEALLKSGKVTSEQDLYTKTTEAVKRKFPHYFENSNRDKPNMVGSNRGAANSTGVGNKGKSKYPPMESLPEDVQVIAKDYIKMSGKKYDDWAEISAKAGLFRDLGLL